MISQCKRNGFLSTLFNVDKVSSISIRITSWGSTPLETSLVLTIDSLVFPPFEIMSHPAWKQKRKLDTQGVWNGQKDRQKYCTHKSHDVNMPKEGKENCNGQTKTNCWLNEVLGETQEDYLILN